MTRLLAMVDAAWRLDYQEDFRLDFSAGFIGRCTASRAGLVCWCSMTAGRQLAGNRDAADVANGCV